MLQRLIQQISFKKTQTLLRLLYLTVAFCGLHLIVLLLNPSLEMASLVRFPVALSAIAVLFLVSEIHQSQTRTGWCLVALTAFSWFLGDVFYGFTEVVLRIEVSRIFWLSIPYFLATFLMIASMGFLGYGLRYKNARLALWLETMMVVVSLGVLIWALFLGNQVAIKPWNELLIDLLSAVLSLGLVGFMFAYLLSHRGAVLTNLFLTLGTIAMTTLILGADALRVISSYQTGHLIDVLASLSFVFFAAAGISSLLPATPSSLERNWVRLVGGLPYVVFGATFVGYLFYVMSPAHQTYPQLVEFGMVIGIGMLALLTAWRILLANKENASLTDQLLESEERLQLALKGANDGLWDWRLSDNSIRQSPRLNALLGYPEIETVAQLEDWQKRTHPEDAERVEETIWRHVRGIDQSEHFSLETRYLCANQEYRWFLLRGITVKQNGRTVRMAGSLTDITGRSGVYDSLTGLVNRVLFREYIERAMQRQKRYGDAFSVMFLDLNDFKIVNDTLGHLVGDALLLQVSKRLEAVMRQGDILARLGGDEFAVLAERRDRIDKTTMESIGIAALAERLCRRLEQPFEISERQILISVSVGIVDSSSGFSRVDEFLSAADTAMYHAKGNKSRIAFFDQAMSVRLNERLELENALRCAIQNNELTLNYQAIFETQSQKVLGYEALLRWQRSDGSAVSPEVFIPIAEQNGFIIELGAWVLNTACQAAAKWRGQLSISVNVASRQFENDAFLGLVQQALQQHQLDPKRLILEITESALLLSAEAKLVALRALGVQVQIDDFGTGYSSLSYLHRLPVSALKVDKSFVTSIDKAEARTIAKAIILLAQSLNLRAIAEGVETREQLAALQELQCDAVQGYLFAKPVPEEQLEDVLLA